MKRTLSAAAAVVIAATAAHAGNVGVDLNLNLSNRPRVAAPAPPAPAPVIVVEEPPEFILPSPLGFYVAIGVPYDMFYIGSTYYVFRNGGWYYSPNYRGPWVRTHHRDLPPGLRKHRIERIREHRDREYAEWRHDRDHYRGRHWRPGKEEWKERKREEHERRKEEKRWEKEERKEHRGHGRGHDRD